MVITGTFGGVPKLFIVNITLEGVRRDIWPPINIFFLFLFLLLPPSLLIV